MTSAAPRSVGLAPLLLACAATAACSADPDIACEDRRTAFAQAIDEHASARECSADADCVLVSATLDCGRDGFYGGCQEAIHRDLEATWPDTLRAIEDDLCPRIESGCDRVFDDCFSTGARCLEGRCVPVGPFDADAGPADAGSADAGS